MRGFLPCCVLLAGVVACGDGAPAPRIPQNLLNCDITTVSCQQGIFEGVAATLGLEPGELPSIRTISVEEYEEAVRSGLSDEDFVDDDPETRGLRLIGFIPDTGQSAREVAVDLQVAFVAAYYSPGSQSITIIDRDYADITAQTILAHEFVHAFQDRQFGISTVFEEVDSTDGLIAARSIIEGDATYFEVAWAVVEQGDDILSVDWDQSYENYQAFAREDAGNLDVPIDASASLVPYAYGYELLGRATQEQGLSARDAFFSAPPASALDTMNGYERFAVEGFTGVDEPAEVLPAPVGDSELSVEDRSGAWYVYATLLRGGFDEAEAWARALEWRGDRFAIFEDGDEVVAVWRIRFDGDAAFVADAVAQTPRDVSWTVLVEGTDAFVIAAESDEALATWEAQPIEVMASVVAAAPNARKSATARLPEGCRTRPEGLW